MNEVDLRTRVLLTMQVALLGMVTPSMRAVSVSWSESAVKFRVFFDRQVDAEITSEIETEVMSHFPSHVVRGIAELISGQPREPVPGEVVVFRRAE